MFTIIRCIIALILDIGLSKLFFSGVYLFSTAVVVIFRCRALYFTAYSQAKQFYNGIFTYESPAVHLVSAISAGMCVCMRMQMCEWYSVMQWCALYKNRKSYVHEYALYALFNANI